IDVGAFQYAALLPGLCSALVAFLTSRALGVVPLSFELPGALLGFELRTALPVLVLGVLCGAVSILLCETMHYGAVLYQRFLPNVYRRAAVGGTLVLLVTILCRTGDYNGAGMDLAVRAIAGEAMVPWAFLLKLLLTTLTLGAGFRGGEIVPTLCIGATFGSVAGVLLGLDPGFAAALGMIAVFCGAVNSPIASIVLSVEFFGSESLLYFAVVCAVSYLLSGKYSLYAAQKLVYSKLELLQDDE
ncbi:MAG: chloride channel protein, partial [Pygmaiobacter sp.]